MLFFPYAKNASVSVPLKSVFLVKAVGSTQERRAGGVPVRAANKFRHKPLIQSATQSDVMLL